MKKDKLTKTKRIANEIIKSVLTILIVILVFVAAVLSYSAFIKKDRVPSFFGYSLFVIATPSMTGSINAGDAVIVTSDETYEVGDVITYFPVGEDVSVTHRIVAIEGGRYFTKGDANNSKDPAPVDDERIVGKVVRVIPKIGIVIEWIKSPAGIIFVVAITAIIILINVVGERKESGEEVETDAT